MILNRKEPFVSILTPVYNGEEFLRECIESVLSQNYSNWEYVIVNNCSTDSTLDIAKEYADKENRIRICNNDSFLKVVDNLNNAFKQISPDSKYCKVIHADDWIFPECIKKMVAIGESYPETGVIGAYRLVNTKVGMDGLSYPSFHVNGKEISRDFLLNEHFYFGAPSNLLIRSNLIRVREKVYDAEYLQADVAACLDFLEDSDFGFVHQVLTFTRRHDYSVTNTNPDDYPDNMFGYLKIIMDYGPRFLNKKEYEERFRIREKAYYNKIANDLIYSKKQLKLYKEELNSLQLEFKWSKLLLSFLKELFIAGLHTIKLQLKRT